MELLKLAIEWAKEEVFSTRFFILFSILFLGMSIGFWKLGKTDLAKAYIIPTLIAGSLLMIIGLGLFFTNKLRVVQFEKAFHEDKSIFLQSEVVRTQNTLKEYTLVFKIIPSLIIIAAFIMLFMTLPIWRASCITAIALLAIILLIDGMAHARIETYHEKLKEISIED